MRVAGVLRHARELLVTSPPFDALFFVSFGGPEGPDDVMPFLDNVLRGRNVPAERKAEVAEHYYRFGGVSPINEQNRDLIQALREDLARARVQLPVYWGNRNWHPMLADALRQMAADGVCHALAFFTTAFSSYSSCRQYREAIEVARQEVGPTAPLVSKLRTYFNHPNFVEAWVERAEAALSQIPADRRNAVHVLFTAHSIPIVMAQSSAYVGQLTELATLVANRLGLRQGEWQLVYQSRSGPPHQPWLEPDVCEAIQTLGARANVRQVVLVPIGFLSDHIEVLFDLDVEAVQAAHQAGLELSRAATLGTHPRLVTMIHELIEERLENRSERPVVGTLGPAPDACPPGCCSYTTAGRPAAK